MEQTTKDLRDSIDTLKKKEELRLSYQSAVIPEPEDQEEHILISILHISLGRISRKFPANCLVKAIYDWVGSLCHDPVNFGLYLPMKTSPLQKKDSIQHCRGTLLSMRETREPIESNYPADEDVNSVYNAIKKKRENDADQLIPIIKRIELNRENVFDNLIEAFANDSEIFEHRIEVVFIGEKASGDGVAREAYDLFLNELLMKTFDGREQYVPLISPEMTQDDYALLGSIMYHFFLNFNVFPIQISQASVMHFVGIAVPMSTMLTSFASTVSFRDGEILYQTFHKLMFEHLKILDVLSKFGIRSNPTPENVNDLILKAAKTHLISKPMFALNGLLEKFKNFFNELPENAVHVLYSKSTPTAEKVLEQLNMEDANDAMEERAYEYLIRFIEEASQTQLIDFLRFTTSTSYIIDASKILVTPVNMGAFAARPKAYTCVKRLIIPKNFNSYLQFSHNFKTYLENKNLWPMDDNLSD